MSECVVAECSREVHARSMCKIHYYRVLRTGTTDVAPRYDYSRTDRQRFEALVRKTPGCWLWLGAIGSKGYPQFRFEGRTQPAHRVAHVLARGPIPDGFEVDHLCRTPLCVRPSHLEAVPPAVNNLRSGSASSRNARKACCPRGHEYDAENTYVHPATGWRRCRRCRANQAAGVAS